MRILLLIPFLLAALAPQAHADLLGDIFTGAYYVNPSLTSPIFTLPAFTVPGGGTLPSSLNFQYSFTANQITFSNGGLTGFSPGAFNGPVFTDTTKSTGITAITLDPASTLVGGMVTFNANQIIFNFAGIALSPGQTFTYDLTFGSPTAATPEPSTIFLAFSGFLAVATLTRRRILRHVHA